MISKISKIITKGLFWLIFTSVVASLIGFGLGFIFNLGSDTIVETSKTLKEGRTLSSILLGLMPDNIINSMASNNIVAVILVAFLFSLSARKIGEQDKFKNIFITYKDLVIFINETVMGIIKNVINFMPYMVIVMISNTIIANGLAAIKDAALFIVLTYASGIVMILVFSLILIFHGLSPIIYYKKSFEVLLLAFTSRSSAGILPYTIRTLNTKLGVSENNANFIASLGTTVGMCGCAGYYAGLVGIFVLQSVGVQIDLSHVILVAIITIIGSLSIAGIPGIAVVAVSIMITGLGFADKFYLLGVAFAIDPIVDMIRTMSNVNGAMVAAICTDKELKTLDEKKYNEVTNE